MKRFLTYLLIILALTGCGNAPEAQAATKGVIFQTLLAGLRFDGATASGYKVHFYVPGTTTAKAIYLDRNLASPAANPYTLNADGRAEVFGSGLYDVVVKTPAGAIKATWENVALQDNTRFVYQVTDFANLAAAVAAIGNTPANLEYATDQTLTANLVVPSTLKLAPQNGAKINRGNYTITFTAPDTSTWPDAQMFTGSGVVSGVKTWRAVWQGAKGDGSIDDLTALRNVALSLPTKVIFSDGATYKISSSVTWGDNVELTGKATIKPYGTSGFIVGNNTKITGLTFDYTAGASPFWGITSDGKTGLEVDGCTFINSRFYLQNTAGVSAGKLAIRNSKFVVDFSAVDYVGTQYDVLSIYGQQGFDISNNDFAITNVHRVMKLSDAVYSGQPAGVVSPYNTRDGKISGNTIRGATTSNKQVIDLSSGANNVIITKNIVDVTGFSSIVENKTARGVATLGPVVNTITANPLLRNDGQVIAIQGALGSETAGADNHVRSLVLTDNFIQSASTSNSAVYVVFQTAANIGGNDIEMTGAVDQPAVQVGSSLQTNLHDNHLRNGYLQIAKVVSDSGGFSHTGETGDIIISRNTITGWANVAGGIQLIGIDTPTANLIIRENVLAHGTVTSGNNASIYSNGITANSLTMKDNVYVGATPTPIFSSPTRVLRVSSGNSWEPATTWAAAVPTTQVYVRGAIVQNSAPSVGQPRGWRVTTAGGAYSTTRVNTTAYTAATWARWTSGTTVWECTTAGTSAGTPPDITGKAVGDTVADGTAVWTMRSTTAAVFTSEGNL